MLGLGVFVVLVFAFPIVFGLGLARVTRVPTPDVPAFVAYCAGMGTAVLAVVVDFLFRLLPHQPRFFYVSILFAIIFGISAAAIVLGRRTVAAPALSGVSSVSHSALKCLGPLDWTMLVLVAPLSFGSWQAIWQYPWRGTMP